MKSFEAVKKNSIKIVGIANALAEIIGIIAGKSRSGLMWRIIGIYFLITGIAFVAAAIGTVNGRRKKKAVKSDKRPLIFEISRNPKQLGINCILVGICLVKCNLLTVIAMLIGILIGHIQIIKREKCLDEKENGRLGEYYKKTSRYLGIGRVSFKKVIFDLYLVLMLWSAFYFCTLLIYAGPLLSMIWIWPILGAFSMLRCIMIYREDREKNRIRLPKFVYPVYLTIALGLIAFFVVVEALVIGSMTATPKEDLEYVIVLGAKVNGTAPANPLLMRINKAEEYMKANPSTILVASGGQGWDEGISEAECIKNQLSDRGIDESRIVLESKSTSTEENLFNTFEIIGDKELGIITNSFHEYRALRLAKQAGFTDVYPVPATTLYPVGIHYIVREFFGVIVYCR